MATFSERMIAKYGAERWAEMNAEVDAYQNREMVTITGADLLNHSVTALIMTGNSYTGELDKITADKKAEAMSATDKTRKIIDFLAPSVLEAIAMVGRGGEITLESIVRDFENTLTLENAKVPNEWLQAVKNAILNHFMVDDVEAALAKDFN